VLLSALRRIGLPYTQFARASCGTIRLKLLKVGALVRLTTGCGFFRAAKFAWKPPRSWVFSRCPRIG
jgi:hypothetical protein